MWPLTFLPYNLRLIRIRYALNGQSMPSCLPQIASTLGTERVPSVGAPVLTCSCFLLRTASCSTTSRDTRRNETRTRSNHNPSRPHYISRFALSDNTYRHKAPPRGSRTLSPFYLILILVLPSCLHPSSLYSIPITDTREIATTIQNSDKAEGQRACI
jgi:hypothetical protein